MACLLGSFGLTVGTYFSLGDSDKESFLLLGTGEHLSLADIKNDPKDFSFDHVELLTLSACETGRANPDRDGREIESLAKITGDRGAKSTIASLWPVADSSTAILMQRFYELRELGDNGDLWVVLLNRGATTRARARRRGRG